MSGCSARGIALRDTQEELEELRDQLKDSIYNVKIEKSPIYKENVSLTSKFKIINRT